MIIIPVYDTLGANCVGNELFTNINDPFQSLNQCPQGFINLAFCAFVF
jgi:hypothetical protein